MKNVCTLIILLFSAGSCSTLSSPSIKKISLLDVEKLEMGTATTAQVQKLFGKPNEVITRLQPNEVWIYDGFLENGNEVQKASFTMNKGVVIGAVWLPYGSDDYSNPQVVLSHFKNAKFKTEKVGWDRQGHYYSDDLIYTDFNAGVSFNVNSYHHTVMGISLGIPGEARVPATKSL